MTRMLTRSQAAAKANRNLRTIDRWIREGKIRGYRVLGPEPVRIPAEDLDKLFEPKQIKPIAS